MSENVTHTAVMEDAFHIMTVSEDICDPFREAAKRHFDFGQLAGITRSGDRFTVGLLADFRERWATRSAEENLEAKLAFVLGWLCHRATDREFKPVFRAVDRDSELTPTECSVYHDAFLVRQLYAKEKDDPYSRDVFDPEMRETAAAEHLEVPQLIRFFQLLLKKVLIQMHTFIPDVDDVEAWLDRLHTTQQQFYVDIERYSRAIAEPDQEKLKRYVTQVCFYDPDDPVVALALKLRRKVNVTPPEMRTALAADTTCHYGAAVALSYRYLRAASDFFEKRTEVDELRSRLDIGRPGRDGQVV
jgi:hypothetical protein